MESLESPTAPPGYKASSTVIQFTHHVRVCVRGGEGMREKVVQQVLPTKLNMSAFLFIFFILVLKESSVRDVMLIIGTTYRFVRDFFLLLTCIENREGIKPVCIALLLVNSRYTGVNLWKVILLWYIITIFIISCTGCSLHKFTVNGVWQMHIYIVWICWYSDGDLCKGSRFTIVNVLVCTLMWIIEQYHHTNHHLELGLPAFKLSIHEHLANVAILSPSIS